MKLIGLVFFIVSLFPTLSGQVDPIIYSVYLIGDTGKDSIPSEAMQLLAFECFDDSLSTVVLLGDNVYPRGNTTRTSINHSIQSTRILFSQFELFVGYRGGFYLIPGNHDWSNGRSSGLEAVEQQVVLSNLWFKENSIVDNRQSGVFFPESGKPGPMMVSNPNVPLDLIFVDSHWFLHGGLFKKKGHYNSLRGLSERREFYNRLDSLLLKSSMSGRPSLLLAHHPIYSNGRHSHRKEPFRFLISYTPLQLFGFLGMNRLLRQDLPNRRYRRYRQNMTEVLSKYPGAVYASGHEHNMQGYIQDSVVYVVSGAGSKNSVIDRYRYPAFFMDYLKLGFFRITYHASGNVFLRAYGVSDRGEYWSVQLPSSQKKN